MKNTILNRTPEGLCSGDVVGGCTVTGRTFGRFYLGKGDTMQKGCIMIIKDVEKWDGPGSLDDAALWGIGPLLELVNLIDLELDESDYPCRGAFWYNRLVCSGLQDLKDCLDRLSESCREKRFKKTVLVDCVSGHAYFREAPCEKLKEQQAA
jgi:hypothetical protein